MSSVRRAWRYERGNQNP